MFRHVQYQLPYYNFFIRKSKRSIYSNLLILDLFRDTGIKRGNIRQSHLSGQNHSQRMLPHQITDIRFRCCLQAEPAVCCPDISPLQRSLRRIQYGNPFHGSQSHPVPLHGTHILQLCPHPGFLVKDTVYPHANPRQIQHRSLLSLTLHAESAVVHTHRMRLYSPRRGYGRIHSNSFLFLGGRTPCHHHIAPCSRNIQGIHIYGLRPQTHIPHRQISICHTRIQRSYRSRTHPVSQTVHFYPVHSKHPFPLLSHRHRVFLLAISCLQTHIATRQTDKVDIHLLCFQIHLAHRQRHLSHIHLQIQPRRIIVQGKLHLLHQQLIHLCP